MISQINNFLSNEVLLIISLILVNSSVLVWYKIFGKTGLLCFTAISTIAANIEVLILIQAFGLSQTLGNVMFASTFLVTDILSEMYGKKAAQTAVTIGITTSITFILVSQLWLLFTPASEDFAAAHIKSIFKNTPRVMLVGLVVYAIVQYLDVWLYHKIWAKTEKKSDKRKYLWLRNNAATLISQLLNSFLFSYGAFWGVFDNNTVLQTAIAGYIVFIFTSLADTPFVYIARNMHVKKVDV